MADAIIMLKHTIRKVKLALIPLRTRDTCLVAKIKVHACIRGRHGNEATYLCLNYKSLNDFMLVRENSSNIIKLMSLYRSQ